jgi:hypothetical protein
MAKTINDPGLDGMEYTKLRNEELHGRDTISTERAERQEIKRAYKRYTNCDLSLNRAYKTC